MKNDNTYIYIYIYYNIASGYIVIMYVMHIVLGYDIVIGIL